MLGPHASCRLVTHPPFLKVTDTMHRHSLIAGKALGALLLGAAALAGPAAAQDDEREPERSEARLDNVGNEGTGVFHLNQAAADAVNQDNVLVAALVAGEGAALADGQTTQANFVPELSAIAGEAAIAGAANRAQGIVGINQSAAAGSSQGNLVGLALAGGESTLAITSLSATARAQGAVAAGPVGASSVSLSDFGNAASGIIQANQSAGTRGAQANIAAIAVAENGIALADALADVEAGGSPAGALPVPSGSVTLADSFNGASGLVQVNQAVGGGNAQTNLLAAAFGSYAHASAISEAGLGDLRAAPSGEETQEGDAPAQLAIGNSFEGFSGIGQVSQVVGYGNQTANTVSVSISRGPGL
jgi:hypothetical protein